MRDRTNWVVTAHEAEIEVLEEFRERAEGGGQIGELDSPSFIAAVVDWVVNQLLPRLRGGRDANWRSLTRKLCPTSRRTCPTSWHGWSSSAARSGLCDVRSRPHREVIVALAHPELDLLVDREFGGAFRRPREPGAQAVEAAREAKESTRGSFDLLVARIGQRTNDIVKLLTLVTVILLPASVLAGVMGMNFKVGLFDRVWMFWAVIAAMLGIAVLVLSIARNRRWI